MHILFKNIHHYTAMATLVFILLLTIVAFIYFLQTRTISGQVRRISFITLIFTHIQVILGIIVLISSPVLEHTGMKDIMGTATIRRSYVEHPFSMIIAAVLLTVANSSIKKSTNISIKVLALAAISLALVIGMIPRAFWSSLFI